MKKNLKSVQVRVFLILCLTITLIISALVIINNVVLEAFYKYSKTETAIKLRTEINRYYNEPIQYNIKSELRQIEIKNNMNILIEDNNDKIIYSANNEMIQSVELLKKDNTVRTIYRNKEVEIKSINMPISSKNLILVSTLDNGYNLYIKIPVTPIKESVRISNKILILIALIMIFISAIMASFVSRKITDPIIKLNKITKKLAKLDFSEKYDVTDTDDEINTLGKNINEMSDKLEATIGQLRKNNNELERDIEQKSKIDEMRKQFISDVSHELKTPIGLIQGYAEGLLENVNDDPESRKFYAEVIIDEAKKMDNMVKKLLELMKLEYEERKFNDEKFDLNKLIKEEIKRETVLIDEKKITIEYKPKKTMVFADQEYIQQVVSNYLTNAIKNCQEKYGEKKISITLKKRENNKIRLFVFNTGNQIPEDKIDMIWGRFYKVDESRNRENGGTGIGLALVRAIMNNYNNKYGVKNLENGGEFYCDINLKGKEKIEDEVQ